MDFGNPQEVYQYFANGLFPELRTLLYGIAWLLGWVLVFFGAYHIGQYGSGKIHHLNMKLILISLFVAVQLIYANEGIAAFRVTLFETPDALSYERIGFTGPFSAYTGLAISFVQLFGLYAYLRGWMIWGFAGLKQSTAEGAFSKGLWHIIGGILAISIVRVMLAFKSDFF